MAISTRWSLQAGDLPCPLALDHASPFELQVKFAEELDRQGEVFDDDADVVQSQSHLASLGSQQGMPSAASSAPALLDAVGGHDGAGSTPRLNDDVAHRLIDNMPMARTRRTERSSPSPVACSSHDSSPSASQQPAGANPTAFRRSGRCDRDADDGGYTRRDSAWFGVPSVDRGADVFGGGWVAEQGSAERRPTG
jgi:hypothetical protein